VTGRAHAGRVEDLLHALLVAEVRRVLDAHARDAELLAQLRGEHDPDLPQALHALDRATAEPGAHVADDRVLVEEPRNLQVVVERALRLVGQARGRPLADAEHARADLGETAREERHLGREAGGEQDDVHAGGDGATAAAHRGAGSAQRRIAREARRSGPSPAEARRSGP
jgi:hypothetical protein